MTRAAPNFGHHFASGLGYRLDGWGDGPLVIRHGKRAWWFEFSDMWGPTLLRKRDLEPADLQPTDESDPFWPPFQAWMAGGKKCRAVWSGTDRNGRRLVRYWVCHVPRDRMLK